MSKIICKDKIFIIETENTHYIIGIDNAGFNRHVYWGKKCDVNDYEIDYNNGKTHITQCLMKLRRNIPCSVQQCTEGVRLKQILRTVAVKLI